MEPRIEAIDARTLNAPVGMALQSRTVEVVDWEVTRLTGGAGGGTDQSAVYRVQGAARDLGRAVPWQIILKILRAPANREPADLAWKREAEAYRSGLLKSLPEGLAAPRCFGTEEFPGGSCWLWLEEVSDELATWPLERYGMAARHLGRLSGANSAEQSEVRWPWLSADWVRQDMVQVIAEADRLRENLGDPLLHRFLPEEASQNALRLLAEREDFLAILNTLPQTLCHFDAFRRNMFSRRRLDQQETVLIDWAFVGRGPIGAEIVSLVWVSLAFGEIDSGNAAALDQIAFDGFLLGLRDVGWHGDPALVRLAYTAAIALRRLGTLGHALPYILDERLHARMEEVMRMPITHLADQWARAGDYIDILADEARERIRFIGSSLS